MSYTTNIKNEITEIEQQKSELIALLSAFIRNNGYLDNDNLYLTTENPKIRDKITKIKTQKNVKNCNIKKN